MRWSPLVNKRPSHEFQVWNLPDGGRGGGSDEVVEEEGGDDGGIGNGGIGDGGGFMEDKVRGWVGLETLGVETEVVVKEDGGEIAIVAKA